MKKSVILVVLLCLLAMVSSIASAEPAPQLTKVTIDAIGVDQSGNWIPVDNFQNPAGTAYGQNLYIQVTYAGMPSGTPMLLQNGQVMAGAQIYINEKKYYNKVLVGLTQCFKVPIGNVHGTTNLGQISVKAFNNMGATYVGYVNNVSMIY